MRVEFSINDQVYDFDLTEKQRDGIVIFAILAEKAENDGVALPDTTGAEDFDMMQNIEAVYLIDNPPQARYYIIAKQHPLENEFWRITFDDLEFLRGMKTAADWLNLPLEYVVKSLVENGVEMRAIF